MDVRVFARAQSPPAPVPVDRAARSGVRVALAMGALTLNTFALALTALPDRVPYPFTDEVIAAQWPGDYLWMYPAIVLMVLFVAWSPPSTSARPRNRGATASSRSRWRRSPQASCWSTTGYR
ncbi:hypothetical protein ACQE98_10485 [Ornithinimicrobium sp. W1679]|uniref:hypothetical protein n=1 Tax=Ornithinimicrobium sp. W1679 TaxID=3418770 RepID=UPI003CF16456